MGRKREREKPDPPYPHYPLSSCRLGALNLKRKRVLPRSHARKGAPWGGMPKLNLEYDPFVDSASLKRLLKDLALGILQGRLYPRQASTVRSLVGMWVRVDDHALLEQLERRITALEVAKAEVRNA